MTFIFYYFTDKTILRNNTEISDKVTGFVLENLTGLKRKVPKGNLMADTDHETSLLLSLFSYEYSVAAHLVSPMHSATMIACSHHVLLLNIILTLVVEGNQVVCETTIKNLILRVQHQKY